ncbi:MAG: RluA family pseudouridine synthase [Flavobacteriales bacterium]
MSSTESAHPVILLQDDHLLIVDKQPGMPVQVDRTGDPSLQQQIQSLFPAGSVDIGSPHRLDRPVSGVVVFTKSMDALRGMDEIFRRGGVEKTYLAIVEGRTPAKGECSHVLGHAGGSRKAKVLEEKDADGRNAKLSFTTKALGERFSLLEVRPEGGAFHQIRAQLAAIGHPIKGDVKYGARRGEPDRSIALHAWRMRFNHPITGAPLELKAPMPTRSIWPALLALAEGDR